jgi:hypothetical protein
VASLIPNLARRPFRNQRPATRLGILLWLLGIGCLAGAGWLYGGYWRDAANDRTEIARLEAAIEAEKRAIAEREAELAVLAIEAGNQQTRELNRWIADRVFSWGGLLDDLEEVLPIGARVLSLSPDRRQQGAERVRSPRNRKQEQAADEFGLRLEGTVESEEALVELLENLYAHPRFSQPDLSTEQREDLRQTRFNLTVRYRPQRTLPDGAAAIIAAGGAGEGVEGEGATAAGDLPAGAGDPAIAVTPGQDTMAAAAGGAVAGAAAPAGSSPTGSVTVAPSRGGSQTVAPSGRGVAPAERAAPAAPPAAPSPPAASVVGFPPLPPGVVPPAAPGGAPPAAAGAGVGLPPADRNVVPAPRGGVPADLPPAASGTLRLVPRTASGGRGAGR